MKELNDLPVDMRNKIVDHCYEVMKKINKKILVEKGIRANLFLELMYHTAVSNLFDGDDYRLKDEDIKEVFMYARSLELIMQEYFRGERQLVAIDEHGNLRFNIQKLIKE